MSAILAIHEELQARRQLDDELFKLLADVNAASFGAMTFREWHERRRELMERILKVKEESQ
jgi:hypothetical protein